MKKILLIAAMLLASALPASAACWQWSKTASSNATADPSINWAEGMSPSSVNDSARAMMARLAECRDDISGALTIGGTASAYTLTTNQGNIPDPPGDGQQVAFVAGFTSGAGLTLAVDGGAAFPVVGQPGVSLAAGTLRAGGVYRVTFNAANSRWQLQDFYNTTVGVNAITYSQIQQVAANRLLGNATGSTANVAEIALGANMSFVGGALVSSAPAAPLAGAFGLVITNNAATPNSIIDITADQATMVTTAGLPIWAQTVSVSVNTSTTGANGIDAGARAANTWYNLYLISNGTVTAGLASLSATAPTMPSGYTYKVRVGAMRTDASGNFYGGLQRGAQMRYKLSLGALGTSYRSIFNSNTAQAIWQAKAISDYAPPTAAAINVSWGWTLATTGEAAIAASPSGAVLRDGLAVGSGAGVGAAAQHNLTIQLENTNLYVATTGGISAHYINATGWTDKVNAN